MKNIVFILVLGMATALSASPATNGAEHAFRIEIAPEASARLAALQAIAATNLSEFEYETLPERHGLVPPGLYLALRGQERIAIISIAKEDAPATAVFTRRPLRGIERLFAFKLLPAKKMSAERRALIEKHIAQLGADNFQEREKASAELGKLFPESWTALQTAAKNDDPEIRKRAADILDKHNGLPPGDVLLALLGGKPPKDKGAPFLGVAPLEIDEDEGVAVSVLPGKSASRGGLLTGDAVLSIDGKKLDSFFDLAEAVKLREPGDVIVCELARGGEKIVLKVTLGTMNGPGVPIVPDG